MYGLTYSIVLLSKYNARVFKILVLRQGAIRTNDPMITAHMLLFPKPRYKGSDNVTYFMGEEFERTLAKDKKVKWLIEFYATWNPDCNEFASVFSELSAK